MSGPLARTLWLDAPQTPVWRAEPVAAPGEEELLCETIVSAISPGTELAAWRGAPPLREGDPYPRVQGYCNVARVLATGRSVEGFAKGDCVLTLQSHRSHFVCQPAAIYLKLEPGMDPRRIAPAYLFHLGYNAVLRSGVRAGSRVVVIGLGVLGLTSVAMAALAGAQVFAVSQHKRARAIATDRYGARASHSRGELGAARTDLAGGADQVILTSNSWEDYRLALDLAGQNGCVACLGFPGRETSPGDYNPLAADPFYTKQLRIEAVGASPLENDARGFNRFNLRDNLGFIARAIGDGALDPEPILSASYRAREIERAYADLAARKDGAVTYLLDWAA